MKLKGTVRQLCVFPETSQPQKNISIDKNEVICSHVSAAVDVSTTSVPWLYGWQCQLGHHRQSRSRRMKNGFGNPISFPLVPPPGWRGYLYNFQMDCHGIYKHYYTPQIKSKYLGSPLHLKSSQFEFKGTTFPLTSAALHIYWYFKSISMLTG